MALVTIIPLSRDEGRRVRCQCEIEQFRVPQRAADNYACNNYATWMIDGQDMCGTHAQSFVWRRMMRENGLS